MKEDNNKTAFHSMKGTTLDRDSMCCHWLMCKCSQPGVNHETITFTLKCQQSKEVMSSKQLFLSMMRVFTRAAKITYLIFIFY